MELRDTVLRQLKNRREGFSLEQPFYTDPDHKAKKHGKPKTKYEYMRRFPKKPRNGEEVGGGHFVFRRGDSTGRIRPCMWPFEHPSYDSALTEATRLHKEHGGTFEVFARVGRVGGVEDGE